MKPAFLVEIQTPKKYLLNGLWFGTKNPHTVYIWVHGLTGNAFSGHHIVSELAKGGAAGMTFGTRGAGFVNSVKRKQGRKTVYEDGGTAFESFTDCVDDIQGAVNFARKSGAKYIFLLGHSTGSQKSIYWASKGGRGVKGIILLGPLSDYASTLEPAKKNAYAAGVREAKRMVSAGKGNELMPRKFTDWMLLSAQRFLSLYTPESVEEIFTYAQSKKPTLLERVKIPILALLAERDEYSSVPADALESWFLAHIYEGEVVIVPKAGHSFKGAEKAVANSIREFAAAHS